MPDPTSIPTEAREALRERVAAAIHAVNGDWSPEGDNECGHGSEPSQCEDAADAVLAALPDSGERPGLDAERLARLIVSYADLTHEVVVTGGDWRDITREWSGVVDECRAYLALATPTRDAQPAEEAARCRHGHTLAEHPDCEPAP